MARIRTIKPAFFRHKELHDLERSTGLPLRVAFAGLWTVADRDGRFKWRPDELKLDCLPFDPVAFADVLAALERGGYVRRYEVAGKAYGWIPSWHDHQKPNKRESESVLPAPDGVCTRTHVQEHGEREEEEEGKGKGTEVCTEAARGSVPVPAERHALESADPTPPLKALVTFPVIGQGGPTWPLTQRQVDGWTDAYPGVDVVAEARKALAWVNANTSRRKTARGMEAFLLGWIGRSVNRGDAVRLPAAHESSPAVDWYAECQALHGGQCGGQFKHGQRMSVDRMKAAAS